MSVRHYSELHPDQQSQVLNMIMGKQKSSKSLLHQALMQTTHFMVIVDNHNKALTVQALPCAYDTYLREQQEINTGKYEI